MVHPGGEREKTYLEGPISHRPKEHCSPPCGVLISPHFLVAQVWVHVGLVVLRTQDQQERPRARAICEWHRREIEYFGRCADINLSESWPWRRDIEEQVSRTLETGEVKRVGSRA